MPKKTLYFDDALRDDFARHRLSSKPLPEDFTYIRRGLFWRALSFFLYYVLAVPIGFAVSRLLYSVRVHNGRVLRHVQGGCFLYANHTQALHDAYMPILLNFPQRNYTVVGPAAVSHPLLGTLVGLLGGIPVPDSIGGLRRFMDALRERNGQGACITIYPEAHIWPYYTGVRPFPVGSFAYPVQLGAPVFAVATTYRARRIFKNAPPRIDVTVGGPFYPNTSLPERKARQALRDEVYDFLLQAISRPDNAVYYEYLPRER